MGMVADCRFAKVKPLSQLSFFPFTTEQGCFAMSSVREELETYMERSAVLVSKAKKIAK